MTSIQLYWCILALILSNYLGS